jgi:CheY-like chemotaxis protein
VSDRRILIVEDATGDVALLLKAFSDEGITNPVSFATKGRDAVEELAGNETLPALILLDLKLPDMPGFELLRVLRGDARLKDVPIVILTGAERASDLDRAHELGANSFLTKPMSFTDFRCTVGGLKKDWLS